jgi:photosystem II stability/assembly factor-like uncharacterized protein
MVNTWKFAAALRAARATACAVMVGMLAACATPVAPIAVERKLTGQEGAVVLKLITNSRTEWDPAETLSSLQLRRVVEPGAAQAPQPEILLLSRTRATTRSTAVFSGMVAPGRYTVKDAVGSSGNATYTFPIGSMLSSFEVRPGEVSLLGTVLVQPLEGTRFNVGYVPPDAELTATFESLFPALAEQTRGRSVHSFELEPHMTRRVALAPLIKRLAPAMYGLSVAGTGDVYAGSKMGRLLWRKGSEKSWRELDVGSWKAIESVRPYRGGLLVAGEEGLLRYSSDEGKTWTSLVSPSPGLIAAAEPLPNGKVVVVARQAAEWTAFVSGDALAGGWRKIGTFADERSLNVPWQGATAVATGNRVGVMMPNGVFQVVDADTEKIERISTGQSVLSVSAMSDGMLVMQAVTIVRTTLVSTDGGRSWVDLDTSRFVQAITFADRKTAYAVAPIKPGVFAGEYGLMASRDGGRTWAVSGTPPGGDPAGVREIMVDRSSGALLAFLRSGSILRSTDEGKTWTRDL